MDLALGLVVHEVRSQAPLPRALVQVMVLVQAVVRAKTEVQVLPL